MTIRRALIGLSFVAAAAVGALAVYAVKTLDAFDRTLGGQS